MPRLLMALCLFLSSALVQAGAYEDILIAANNDETAAVVNLVKRGMDVNTTDPSGTTLLMIAARNGNVPLLQSLLASRANVNRRNRHGDTALLMAVLKPSLEASKLLLDHGADPNPPGWAPLHYSMLSDSKEIAKLLIAKGANVDARAPNSQTALMLAVKQGKIELVTLLVEANADKDLKDADGVTALGHARKMDHSDTIKYLQKVGAAG